MIELCIWHPLILLHAMSPLAFFGPPNSVARWGRISSTQLADSLQAARVTTALTVEHAWTLPTSAITVNRVSSGVMNVGTGPASRRNTPLSITLAAANKQSAGLLSSELLRC